MNPRHETVSYGMSCSGQWRPAEGLNLPDGAEPGRASVMFSNQAPAEHSTPRHRSEGYRSRLISSDRRLLGVNCRVCACRRDGVGRADSEGFTILLSAAPGSSAT